MSRKSLVIAAKFEIVKAAHNCQANSTHRLQKDDIRLAVKNGRSWDNYCKECGEGIIARDIEKLIALQKAGN